MEYTEIIKSGIDRIKSKALGVDELVEVYSILYEACYANIFKEMKRSEDENGIRDTVRAVIVDVLPRLKSLLSRSDLIKAESMCKLIELYDDFYAIAAYRSLEHFALYLDLDKNASDKLWTDTLNCFKGFWYYANKMVLDDAIVFIEKQLPAGYGKCCARDTKVLTPRGEVEIGCLAVGDEVYTEYFGEVLTSVVTQKWETKKKQVRIKTSSEEVVISPEHRMKTQRGYIQAKDITLNDFFYRLVDGAFVLEKIVKIEAIDEEIDMVDIEVAKTHNFLANGFVSHNSMSDNVLIAWIFGIEPNTDICKIFGAKINVSVSAVAIEQIMLSKKYAKVFPDYEKFGCDPKKMYAQRTLANGAYEMRLTTAEHSRSLLICSKEKDINGVRAKYMFLDDITQHSDMNNIRQHVKDCSEYTGDWEKRRYDSFNFHVIASGTTYHYMDILSYLKDRFNFSQAERSKVNKYTSIAHSDRLRPDGVAVFVSVPKLDFDTDKSTYESKYPTKQAKFARDACATQEEFAEFMAMEQQRPVPPEGNPFYWGNIKTYKELPIKIDDGGTRENYCLAMIDLPRTGANNFSLAVLSPNDENNRFGDKYRAYYLVDCIYRKTPLDKMDKYKRTPFDEAAEMLARHNVTKCGIECNVQATAATDLKKALSKIGHNCEVVSVYTTKNKVEKIENAITSIQENIIVPCQGMYSYSSDMGRFLKDFVNWNNKTKDDDDAPDTLAMFSDTFIRKKKKAALRILSGR